MTTIFEGSQKFGSISGDQARVTAIEDRVLIRAADGKREVLKTWSEGQVSIEAPGPGVYRVEVWITPRHLVPYLADAPEDGELEVPWVYSGALFVRP